MCAGRRTVRKWKREGQGRTKRLKKKGFDRMGGRDVREDKVGGERYEKED